MTRFYICNIFACITSVNSWLFTDVTMYKSEIIRLIPYPFSQISKFTGNLPIALKFSILTRFIAVVV